MAPIVTEPALCASAGIGCKAKLAKVRLAKATFAKVAFAKVTLIKVTLAKVTLARAQSAGCTKVDIFMPGGSSADHAMCASAFAAPAQKACDLTSFL
jgi:hypothetical protein